MPGCLESPFACRAFAYLRAGTPFAEPEDMRVAKHVASGIVPVAIALTAFLNARSVNALLEATVGTDWLIPNANAATTPLPRTEKEKGSASTILAHDVFDSSQKKSASPIPEATAQCEGVRPLVLVGSDDPDVAFAAVDVAGKKILARRGDDMDGHGRVAYVAIDRLWLERNGTLCQSRLFGPRELPKGPTLEGVTKHSATDMSVDRALVDKLLENQTELMKVRLVPESGGMKVSNIKPGSPLATLGVENGDRLETINGMEVSSPEKMLSAWTQLRAGTLNRVQVKVNRNGKGVNLDYEVK